MKTKKVFVVHGRNEQLRIAIFDFLRALGLEPQEWSQLLKLSTASDKEASPYIGNVVSTGLKNAVILVLLTGDDEARLSEELVTVNDPSYERELTRQPRPNVLLEAGMALGAYPERTILVQFGKLKKISDLEGRQVTFLDNSAKKRQELKNRLEGAGCIVSDSGEDWLKVGDFRYQEPPTPNEKAKTEASTDSVQITNLTTDENEFPRLIKVLKSKSIKLPMSGITNGKTADCFEIFTEVLRNSLVMGFFYSEKPEISGKLFIYACPILQTHGLVRLIPPSRTASACYQITEKGNDFLRYVDFISANESIPEE